MAVVRGVKEKVHLPIYDSLVVDPERQLRESESSSTLRFFVNVQNKTKLETNLQSASLLPHYNTFEARALRVVISDLPPQFPGTDEVAVEGKELEVLDEDDNYIDTQGRLESDANYDDNLRVEADVKLSIRRVGELLKDAKAERWAELDVYEDGVTLVSNGTELTPAEKTNVENADVTVVITAVELEDMLESVPKSKGPPAVQISPNNGAGTIISKLIYNTVTTLYVGEKVMIQMPTWFFPSGAGPYSESAAVTTHGEPSPMATFRFAEPIYIDKQQNFRVEMEVPDSDVLKELQRLYGPLTIWVVLDGFMTRDVQ